jgi:hypothetical protein
MAKIIIHRPSGSVLTIDRQGRAREGLNLYLHNAATGARPFRTRDAELKQIPGIEAKVAALKAKYEEAKKSGSPADISATKRAYHDLQERMFAQARSNRDSTGAFLRPGSHRPETRARKTPIDDANGVLTEKLSKLIDDYHAKRVTRKQLEEEARKGGISMSDLRYLLDEED